MKNTAALMIVLCAVGLAGPVGIAHAEDTAAPATAKSGSPNPIVQFFRNLFGGNNSAAPSHPTQTPASPSNQPQAQNESKNAAPQPNPALVPGAKHSDTGAEHHPAPDSSSATAPGNTQTGDHHPSHSAHPPPPARPQLPASSTVPANLHDIEQQFQQQRDALLNNRNSSQKDLLQRLKEATGETRQDVLNQLREEHDNWLEQQRELREQFHQRIEELRQQFQNQERDQILNEVKRTTDDLKGRAGEN